MTNHTSKHHSSIASFCKYSGVVLQTTNQFNNFGKLHSDTIVPSVHPVLHFGLQKLITYACHKPAEKLSATERHILAVAMLRHTGAIKILFPITDKTLKASTTISIFDELVQFSIMLNNRWPLWEQLLPKIPHIAITKENYDTVNLATWLVEILVPAMKQLTSSVNGFIHGVTIGPNVDLDGPADFESQLKQDLDHWNARKKRTRYHVNIGHWAIDKLEKALGPIDLKVKQELKFYLNSPPEKIRRIKRLIEIRELFKTVLPLDESNRLNTLLILRNLDAKIEYHNDIAVMFGGVQTKTKADLPDELGISYDIIGIPTMGQNLEVQTKHEISKGQKLTNPNLAKLAIFKKNLNTVAGETV